MTIVQGDMTIIQGDMTINQGDMTINQGDIVHTGDIIPQNVKKTSLSFFLYYFLSLYMT